MGKFPPKAALVSDLWAFSPAKHKEDLISRQVEVQSGRATCNLKDEQMSMYIPLLFSMVCSTTYVDFSFLY